MAGVASSAWWGTEGASHNVVLNHGSNRVRYPVPVSVGCRIHVAVELPTVEDIADGAHVTFPVVYEVGGKGKPGCVAGIVYRYHTELAGSRT